MFHWLPRGTFSSIHNNILSSLAFIVRKNLLKTGLPKLLRLIIFYEEQYLIFLVSKSDKRFKILDQ